jgi:hypothetical protein
MVTTLGPEKRASQPLSFRNCEVKAGPGLTARGYEEREQRHDSPKVSIQLTLLLSGVKWQERRIGAGRRQVVCGKKNVPCGPPVTLPIPRSPGAGTGCGL